MTGEGLEPSGCELQLQVHAPHDYQGRPARFIPAPLVSWYRLPSGRAYPLENADATYLSPQMPINQAPSANATWSPQAPPGQHLEAAAEAADQGPRQGSALIRIESPGLVFRGRGRGLGRVRASDRGRGREILLGTGRGRGCGRVRGCGRGHSRVRETIETMTAAASTQASEIPIYLFVTRIPSIIFSTC